MGYMKLFDLKFNLHYHWLNHPIFPKRKETEITVLKRWLKLVKLLFLSTIREKNKHYGYITYFLTPRYFLD